MPVGTSWSQYIKFVISASLSMFAGAQVVHQIYRPLDGLQELIEDEKRKVGKSPPG